VRPRAWKTGRKRETSNFSEGGSERAGDFVNGTPALLRRVDHYRIDHFSDSRIEPDKDRTRDDVMPDVEFGDLRHLSQSSDISRRKAVTCSDDQADALCVNSSISK